MIQTKALFLFDNWSGDRDSLVVKVGRYIWSSVKGMTPDLWKKLEHSAVQKGIFTKGGFMYTVEELWKEGFVEGFTESFAESFKKNFEKSIQEGEQRGIKKGRQEERQQVIFNMLKKKLDSSLISEVTGLPEKEIKKLKTLKGKTLYESILNISKKNQSNRFKQQLKYYTMNPKKEKGRQEGIQEGWQEDVQQVVFNMLKKKKKKAAKKAVKKKSNK